jgi:peptide/nickel transport system substrate-binding protein
MVRIAAAALALLLATACAPQQYGGVSAQAQPSMIYGLTLQPSGFDPHINASSELGIPLRSVYDTLVYRHPDTNQFVPGLATAWEISPDGLSMTFTLRQGVTFHDGTPFNAQAVAANLDRITAPETASQKAVFLLGPYIGHEIVDDYTIRLRLSEAYSPLLDALSQVYLGMASPTAFQEYGLERYQLHQVGTGPYQFVEYLPGDHLTLRRNDAYAWAPEFMQPNPARPEVIEFRFFEDPPSRALALQNGDVQVVGELLPTDARNLATSSEVRVLPVGVAGQPLQFLINTARFPTNDERVRQAILFATNREAIIDGVFQRFSPVAWGPFSATTQYYSQTVIGRYAYDINQANVLLDAVGLLDNDGNGYRDFGGAEIEITVIVPPWGLIPQVAQYLEQQWRDVGLRAVLEQVPSRAGLSDAIASGEYNLVASYDFGVDPSFIGRYYTSGAANNYTGFADTALDTMFAQAQQQYDEAARQSLYTQAQNLIMDRALVLPIRDYVNLNGFRSEVAGLDYDAYGWFPQLAQVSMTGEIAP